MIRLSEVSLRLGKAGHASSVQFDLPFFEAASGETIALTGPSGCGKSTLLNLIAGLRRPDRGEVIVAGADLAGMPTERLDRHRGVHCGMVFQSFHLLAPFSAVENVAIGLRFGARKSLNTGQRASEVLRRVGLGDRLHARPDQLSVGERQRVAIARAIAGDAPILLADEPTGSLDPGTGREIFSLLREVASENGRTLLMVTHDSELASELPVNFDCTGLVSSYGPSPEGREALA
ncbi:MAG TPA: ABC transporter [Opitutae bacterium]|nr:ABC transporter [Opitutae bacterium]|tara:strand:- start:8457 stop:9158 length:702 start_codon:yes stop_codon:yes gene_type:complete